MSKRANGEGAIRRRADGRWEIRVTVGVRPDGTLDRKSFYGKTQREAKDAAKAYLSALEDGLDMESYIHFEEWADAWYEHHKENVSVTTAESYRYTLRTLKDFFKGKKLREIKAMDVENLLRKMRRDGRSDSYISKSRAMLFQIMHRAEANDLIRKNPVPLAEKMRKKMNITPRDAFTEEEVSLLMSKLPYDRMGWSIRLMLGTGMRMQEILGLEPRYIEPDGSVIYIRQAVVMEKGTPVIGSPKTLTSVRSIPIPASLRKYAVALRSTNDKFVWEVGVKGQPCNPSYFRDHFKKYVEAIPGVRVLTPHCCRHTYVSQMQALGVDIETIKSLVGHANIDMTQHYLHVQDPVKKDAIERFDAKFRCA